MSNNVEFLVNQKMEIELEDGIYKSNIQDVTDEYIGISIPVNEGKYVPLRKDDKVICLYYYNKDIYRFETVVLGRKIDKLLIIMLKRPEKVMVYQRRNFARVPLMINIYCGLIENNKKIESIGNNQIEFFDAYSLDISGGGLRLAIDRSFEKRLSIGSMLLMTIPLNDENITVKGKIVRVENDKKNPKIICGLSFMDLDRLTRESIIRLVFKTMREQMKKGAKGE